MIRQCSECDRSKVMMYLNENRVLNLFFIGDINNFGFDSDFQKVYIDEKESNVCAVYLLFRDSLLLCSYTHEIDQVFVNDMIEQHNIMNINGDQSVVDSIQLHGFSNDDCYFCKMIQPVSKCNNDVKIATIEHVEEISKMRKFVFNQETSGLKEDIQTKTGRTYFIERDGKIISSASTTAETEGLAMVVGVLTLPEYRGQGYASTIMKKLCFDLLQEEKVPCLFYNNPTAGKIYHRIGFVDIGRWALRRNEKV